MNAMILGAGYGTRLRPLTYERPKPLIPLLGRPILRYHLDQLIRVGIRNVVINTHHLPEMMAQQREALAADLGISITLSHEPDILGSGGGIKQAEAWLSGDDFLVLNGDTIMSLPLLPAIRFHQERQALATMIVRDHPEIARYGAVQIDATGSIRDIVGLLGYQGQERLFARLFTGVHIFSPGIFDFLPAGFSNINHSTYPAMIRTGQVVLGFETARFWADLGTIPDYVNTTFFLLDQPSLHQELGFTIPPEQFLTRNDSAGLARMMARFPGVTFRPPVFIGQDVALPAGSCIGPYVVMESCSHLFQPAMVRDTIVWDGVAVPNNTHGMILTKSLTVEIPRAILSNDQ